MSLVSQVAAIYLATVQSDNVRYRQYPAGLAGIVIADDAAWDEITDSTTSPQTNWWLAGLNIGTTQAAAADSEQVVAIGSGGVNGATVAASVLLAEQDMLYNSITAVGEYPMPYQYFPTPIRVLSATRIAGRISTSATGGVAITLGYQAMLSLGN